MFNKEKIVTVPRKSQTYEKTVNRYEARLFLYRSS